MELTHEQKIALYRAGRYSFEPPPVYRGNWDENSWIKWIDSNGHWYPPQTVR